MNRSLKFNQKYFGLMFVYFFELIVFYRWFLPGNFFNGDIGLMLKGSLQNITFLTMWKGYTDVGVPSFDAPLLLILGAFDFFAKYLNFGFNDMSIRLLFFLPYMILAPLGMYLLTLHLTKSRLASTISSLVYTFSTTIMALYSMGHILLTMPYVFFPFIILFTIKFFNTGKSIYLPATSLLLIICSIYELRITYLIILWLSVFLLYYALFCNQLKLSIYFLSSIIGSLILFNLFWILPYTTMSSSPSNVAILGRELFGAGYISIIHALTLTHPFWGKSGLEIFTKQAPFLFSFAYPILAILGIMYQRKSKIIIPISSLLVISIFLTKQTNMPFIHVYEYLYAYFPGFSAFRESTKFFQIGIFGFSLLIGYCFSHLQQIRSQIVLALCLGLVLLNVGYLSKPIFTGTAQTLFVSKNISDKNYISLNNFLLQKNKEQYFRTLWIPAGPNLSIIKDQMPQISLLRFYEYIQMYSTANYDGVKDKSTLLSDPIVKKLLDEYSIKYVILSNQKSTISENTYELYEPKANYSSVLSKQNFLERISIPGSNIEIYENDTFYGHITLSNILTSSLRDSNSEDLKYTQKAPFEYELGIEYAVPAYVHFSEAHHPDWKLRVGNHNWFKSLIQKDYYYPDEYHIKTEYGLNSWKIDPDWFYNQGYQEGYTVPITLYFAPQAWMDLGLIIGITTVAILFVITSFILIYNHWGDIRSIFVKDTITS